MTLLENFKKVSFKSEKLGLELFSFSARAAWTVLDYHIYTAALYHHKTDSSVSQCISIPLHTYRVPGVSVQGKIESVWTTQNWS